jgi:hypothetical protein
MVDDKLDILISQEVSIKQENAHINTLKNDNFHEVFLMYLLSTIKVSMMLKYLF